MLGEERRSRLLETVRTTNSPRCPNCRSFGGIRVNHSQGFGGCSRSRGSIRRIHGGVLYVGSGMAVPQFDNPRAGPMGPEKGRCPAGGRPYRRWRYGPFGRRQHHLRSSALAGWAAFARGNDFAACSQSVRLRANSDLVLIGGNVCPGREWSAVPTPTRCCRT